MEKQKSRKKIKGLSLISLTIAVVILIIISSLLIYNAKNGVKIRAYKMLQNDIQILDDKINSYYAKYSAIPAEIEYKNTTLLDRMFNETEKSPNDGEEYYVIDLKALDGVTLNYGKDYENITSEEDTRKYDDVYVINKDSHHIYYVRGIELDGKWKYTNENDDEVEILVKKKWKMAVEKYSDDGGVAYAIDSRGELYIVPMGYKGKINENKDYVKMLDSEIFDKKIFKIVAGETHTVAIDEEGELYTWGYNEVGQLGDGTTTNSANPICISGKENEIKGKKIVGIAAGGGHTVAIDEDGELYTWGYNEYGQLGDGTTTNSVNPICISGKENEIKGKKIVEIAAGGGHTVAIDEEGELYTWGDNEYGQLGDGTTTNSVNPICISDKENAIKGKKIVGIAAGDDYTVAIDENGKVYTWGDNWYGQLGDGTGNDSEVPTCISDDENTIKGKKIVGIAAGKAHTVAIDENGKVYIWGNDIEVPICISEMENEIKGKKVVDVMAGSYYIVVLDDDGYMCILSILR